MGSMRGARQGGTVDGERLSLRIGAVCLAVGSVAVFVFRAAHGDLPAGVPEAALRFISSRPYYAWVHLGTVLGVVAWVGGLVALSDSLTHRAARTLGRLGAASALVGSAVFVVDFSIDGFAGRALADAWAAAPPAGQEDLVRAADTVFKGLGGTSLTSIAVLWGLPPILFGRAVMLEGYSYWLGWAGSAVGAATFAAATAQFLHPDIISGFLIYGPLVFVVQLWSFALGVAMWHRAGAPAGTAADVCRANEAGS